MMELKLVDETVETRILNNQDIAIIDYRNKHTSLMTMQEIDIISRNTEVHTADILASLEDHDGLEDHDDIYVINGFTFLYVKDLINNPIRRWVSNSINSSINLYKLYAYESLNRYNPVEVLDLLTGEILTFYNHLLALRYLKKTTYDILKIPVYADRTITDYENYVFESINDHIIRFSHNLVSWSEYICYALDDLEALDCE